MAVPPVIDLGVLGSDAVPVPTLAVGRRPLARPRPLVVLATVAAVLLGLAGAGAPGSGGLTALASVPVASGARYAVEGDTLYVADPAATGNRVTAYRLGDGRVRWSTPVTVLASLVDFQHPDGVLLASSDAPGVSGDHTVALDERTGRVLWRSAVVSIGVLPAGGRVLLARALDQHRTELSAVGARDGGVAWTEELGAGCEHAEDLPAAGGMPIAVLCPVGDPDALNAGSYPRTGTAELRTVDPASGREVRSVRLSYVLTRAPDPLAVLRPETTPPIGPILSVAAGRVLVGTPTPAGASLAAYDPATLSPLWTRQMSDDDFGATPCGGALCLSDGYGLSVVDPGTGAVRWQTPERAYAEPPGTLAGRLLVEPLGGQKAVLVDVGTGRPVLDLSGWRAVAAGPGSASIFARWLPNPDGRAWFATVAGSPLAVRLIGFAADVLKDQCRTDGAYLVCQTLEQTLRIWRYRAG